MLYSIAIVSGYTDTNSTWELEIDFYSSFLNLLFFGKQFIS